jgi:hypothetical protein
MPTGLMDGALGCMMAAMEMFWGWSRTRALCSAGEIGGAGRRRRIVGTRAFSELPKGLF